MHCRGHLRQVQDPGPAHALAAGDQMLRQALGKREDIICIRGSYTRRNAGNKRDDPLRAVLLKLLKVRCCSCMPSYACHACKRLLRCPSTTWLC